MMNIERFHKEDWYAYAGAHRFEDGSDPFIMSGEEYDVLFCSNGDGTFSIDITYLDEECYAYGYVKEVNSYQVGMMIMEYLQKVLTGFLQEDDAAFIQIIDMYGFESL